MKYATITGVLTYAEGMTVAMREGDSYDDDHPAVEARPELFTDEVPPARNIGRERNRDRLNAVETTATTPGGRRLRGR